MDYDEYIAGEEKTNSCGYCGENCEKDFCNKECYKAYLQD